MLTLEQAQALRMGGTIYHLTATQGNGKETYRARKTGAVKVWKRTGGWRMPIKHGLYESGYVGTQGISTFGQQAGCWSLEDPRNVKG